MLGRYAISAAAVVIALGAQAASADEVEGIIKSITMPGNRFVIEDKVYQWSSMNTLGPRLDQLHEGDKVKVRYIDSGSGNIIARRITLLSTASAAAASAAAPAAAGWSL
jgi:hypothetical protein